MKYIVETLVRNNEDMAVVTKTAIIQSNIDLTQEDIYEELDSHYEDNGYLLLEILDVNLGA